jgi:hypothetical protein
MTGAYFVGMAFGFPLLILALSLLLGYLSRRSDAEMLDWKPTRSPAREAELALNDINQMRTSLNDLRRRRDADEHPPDCGR